MGRSIKDTRRRIDTGCLDNGYRYHCWSCGFDLYTLCDDETKTNEADEINADDIYEIPLSI